jgi:hypothetical protein
MIRTGIVKSLAINNAFIYHKKTSYGKGELAGLPGYHHNGKMLKFASTLECLGKGM